MNYRTRCPQCTSVFLIGTDQLDAAQGWVQCSVCGAAFNAQPSLHMEDGSSLPSPEPAAIEPPALTDADSPLADAPNATEVEPSVIESGLLESDAAEPPSGMAAEPAALIEQAEPNESNEAANLPVGIAQRESPQDIPSIILIDPAEHATDLDDLGPMPVYDTSAYPNLPPAETDYPPAPSARANTLSARIEYASPMPGSTPIRRVTRMAPWVWGGASTLLLLVLVLQLTYHFRDTLVSQFPALKPGIEQGCAIVGCTLSLPKNLALLQIVGSDLQTETSGRLKLTLTLGNRATHVQAWPVLVLTLTDQRNRPLARRSFAPSEYLEDPQRIAAGMPPRREQALSLPLTVRDLAPMGFDLRLAY